MSIELQRIHHVAYRCKDAKETVDFYQRVLNMGFVLAIAENEVPSTKEPDPYMHVFLDAGMGKVIGNHDSGPLSVNLWKDNEIPAFGSCGARVLCLCEIV